ncbi:MAG: leucine-rich repeat protein, partial [Eubacterium sp.]|nr:leucine-rich repeat protein [Eubacterium sp.]
IIPESVEYIGESAFEGCSYLESVVVPDGATVGNRAFKNCHDLTSATISTDYLDRFDKSILTDLTVTGTWIEENAFRNLDNLQNVTIANSVTSIGKSAFYNCANIEEITIPENVTNIGESAFVNCSNLKSITILGKNCHIAGRHEYSNISMEAIPAAITIYGYYGTPTQAYARENRNEFIPLDNSCNHAWNRMEIIEYATCFGEGTMEYTCDWCFSKKTEAIPAKGHTIVTDEAVEPTCTTDGKTEGSHCIAGDAVIVEQQIIPATGHSYDSGKVTQPATCTVNGVMTYTCANCNEPKTAVIPAAGHNVVTDKAVAATCTKAGKTEGSHCSVCNEVITAQETVPAKGHNYKTTTTKATTKANGSVVKKCSVCGVSTKTTIYYPKTITLSKTSYTYNGKAQKPTVTVKDSKGKKISASNYTVSYASGRKNVGTYKVTIKFKGNYSGTATKSFTINPKATALSSVTAGKKKFTVKWKKLTTQTTGYQIQYSTSSKFSSAKTVTVSKNKTTSKTVSSLKAKKKYYVRVRTYKTVKVNGKSTKIYSSWSKSKSIKTK